MQDLYVFTYDQAEVNPYTSQGLPNGQSNPVNIYLRLQSRPLPHSLTNVVLLPLLFRNPWHQEHYHLEKHSATHRKPNPRWMAQFHRSGIKMANLYVVFPSADCLSAQAPVFASPSQAGNAKSHIAYTILNSPSQFLSGPVFILRAVICADKEFEMGLSL